MGRDSESKDEVALERERQGSLQVKRGNTFGLLSRKARGDAASDSAQRSEDNVGACLLLPVSQGVSIDVLPNGSPQMAECLTTTLASTESSEKR